MTQMQISLPCDLLLATLPAFAHASLFKENDGFCLDAFFILLVFCRLRTDGKCRMVKDQVRFRENV